LNLENILTGETDGAVYSIGAVARMVDIPASTLRAWEERYALISPARSEGSQRLYSRAQVEQLRFVKAQIDAGASAADAHRLLAQEVHAGRPPVATDPAGGPRALVLIAERDPYAAELAEHFLRTEGYDVAVALDATHARQLFHQRAPNLVLVDLLVSGNAGFRLVDEFASAGPAQVLAVSAVDSGEEAIRLGAAAFLRKPLEALRLVATVRDLINAGGPVRTSRRQPARA